MGRAWPSWLPWASPPTGPPRRSARYRALTGGRLHALPTGPATLLRTGALGTRSRAQLVRLLGLLPRLRPRELGHTPVAEWLAGHRLRPDADAMVRALIRLGTYTDDVDRFSADAALTQLQSASRAGVLYLHGGWSGLLDALSDSLDLRTGVEVEGIDRGGAGVEVRTAAGTLTAGRVVVATGGPGRRTPAPSRGPRVGRTRSPRDRGLPRPRGVPGCPRRATSSRSTIPSTPRCSRPRPARHPRAGRWWPRIRYGARSAAQDRPQLESLVATAGVGDQDVVVRRFLARMVVYSALPLASAGGLAGRPGIEDTGVPGVTMAGDWIGPVGLLADASLASGHAAGGLAGRGRPDSSIVVA